MKLIDKIKNYFYDEEEEDAAKKTAQPKVEPAPFKPKEEPREEKRESTRLNDANVDAISERELFKSDPTFNFPIIFDDEDFKEEKVQQPRIPVTKNVQTKTVETVVEKKVFKPSPNISPIYGVIDPEPEVDKTKDKSKDNLLNLYEGNKKIDIDDILGKVYEPTRVELKRESYVAEKVESVVTPKEKDDLAIDFFNNIETEVKEERKTKIEVTTESIESVDEKLKSIDELLENTDEEDFYSLVDSMYKEDDEEGDK